MNRLVLIGNGFDLAHGLKTSYKDFIDWYWGQRVNGLMSLHTKENEDILCKLSIKENKDFPDWFNFFFYQQRFLKDPLTDKNTYTPQEIILFFKETPNYFSMDCSPLLERIMNNIETRGWADIEIDYYQLLKMTLKPECKFTVNDLNSQLLFLRDKLVEYLNTMNKGVYNNKLNDKIIEFFNPKDFSTEGKLKAANDIGSDASNIEEVKYDVSEREKFIPKQIMMLSFNYTNTALNYGNFNMVHNYIHGELTKPKHIIFGYGDELDKNYQNILDANDNEMLRYVKSVKYLETSNYRKMLQFIESAPFQLYIMGHSCGNSDRTLLNTVFEHENCISIKPFYHILEDGIDNYLDIVQNISRNFTDMKKFRDRVVNKEQCETL